ncbi:MAG: hypothetical protein HETSPECPRED_003215, partial [Heterodermia speciosa]
MILQPSLKRNYASLDELYAAVQAHALKENYAIVIKRFKKIYFSNEKRKCVLICDRDDITKRKKEAKPRKIESKKCGCEFKIN